MGARIQSVGIGPAGPAGAAGPAGPAGPTLYNLTLPLFTLLQTGAVADATDYFAGSGNTWSVVEGRSRINVPMAGTVMGISVNLINVGTLSSGETSTMWLRLNAATDFTISTAVVASATLNNFNEYALNGGAGIAVVQNDGLELKWTTPTWVTNPTQLALSGYILLQIT